VTATLEKLESEAKSEIERCESKKDLDSLRVKYTGKKSQLTQTLRSLGSMPSEQRREVGQAANRIKSEIEAAIKAKRARLSTEPASRESLDITLPGRTRREGRLHPIITTMDEIVDIFLQLGFRVEEGPEVESEYYNFVSLNMPKDHPCRDMQDTFYVSEDVVLRTHTSPVQTRTMEKYRPPVRVVAPGKVYRRDADVSHSPMFFQVEGFAVDEDITFADLRGTLTTFLHRFFGPEIPVRFRASYFPFTEPSGEIDIGCVVCGGEGCRVCKQTGWLEILGCGMIHPEVFRHVDYDYEKYTGFAFGMGVDRIAMLKYGIDDIKLFFENDHRFLDQF